MKRRSSSPSATVTKPRRQRTEDKVRLNEEELTASICRDSFYQFVLEFWDTIVAEEFQDNWHIHLFCEELQQAAERVFDGRPKLHDLIFNVPPGTTKSTIITILFPCWVWTRMPSARFITASHTEQLVQDHSRKAREVIRSEKYKRYFPEIVLTSDQDTKGYFVNDQGGMRLSCTVGGKTPTGFHAHFILIDDPIDPMKSLSEVELTAANNFMVETLPTRKVNKEVTLTVLVMQRLHQNDPTGNWLERAKSRKLKIRHFSLPAEITDDVRPVELRKYYQDGLLDPRRLSSQVLEEYKSLGDYTYSGQFLQNPIPRGGGMFKVDKMILEDHAPNDFQQFVRYWDNAATKDGDGAYSVGVKMGIRKGTDPRQQEVWVLDVRRGRWSVEERESQKMQCAQLDGKKTRIGQEQEPGAGGKESAEATARRLLGYRVKIDRPTGDKVSRAEPFAYACNNGAVHVLNRDWTDAYLQEHMYFPNSTYKDQVDASSGAFNMISGRRLVLGSLFNRKSAA